MVASASACTLQTHLHDVVWLYEWRLIYHTQQHRPLCLLERVQDKARRVDSKKGMTSYQTSVFTDQTRQGAHADFHIWRSHLYQHQVMLARTGKAWWWMLYLPLLILTCLHLLQINWWPLADWLVGWHQIQAWMHFQVFGIHIRMQISNHRLVSDEEKLYVGELESQPK